MPTKDEFIQRRPALTLPRNSDGTFGKRHGHGNHGKPTPTYYSWVGMKARCYSPNTINYYLYGGRGITVCERWMDFTNFLEGMSERPDGMSLDRIDNNGNYEPSNCRWATRSEQQQNTRVVRMLTCDGLTLSMSAWARRLGVTKQAIFGRLRNGWDVETALTFPFGEVVFPRNEKGQFICQR